MAISGQTENLSMTIEKGHEMLEEYAHIQVRVR
jgi:hypothetical protein